MVLVALQPVRTHFMENPASRLQHLMDEDELNQTELAKKIKKTKGLINGYLKAESKPSGPFLSALEDKLGWSARWIRTGSGPQRIATKLDHIVAQDLPSIKESRSNLEIETVRTHKAQLYLSELPEKDAESYIPYYDVEITAGKLEQVFDDADEIPAGYIYAPQYHDCIACNVKGDSMYDRIFPGSRLYVYQLRNKKYIDFGHIYLVVIDGYRLLKYIDPDPNNEERVILRSHNSDQYKNWPVDKADILHLFLVKGYENQNAN